MQTHLQGLCFGHHAGPLCVLAIMQPALFRGHHAGLPCFFIQAHPFLTSIIVQTRPVSHHHDHEVVGGHGFAFYAFVVLFWRHALRSEWPFCCDDDDGIPWASQARSPSHHHTQPQPWQDPLTRTPCPPTTCRFTSHDKTVERSGTRNAQYLSPERCGTLWYIVPQRVAGVGPVLRVMPITHATRPSMSPQPGVVALAGRIEGAIPYPLSCPPNPLTHAPPTPGGQPPYDNHAISFNHAPSPLHPAPRKCGWQQKYPHKSSPAPPRYGWQHKNPPGPLPAPVGMAGSTRTQRVSCPPPAWSWHAGWRRRSDCWRRRGWVRVGGRRLGGGKGVQVT